MTFLFGLAALALAVTAFAALMNYAMANGIHFPRFLGGARGAPCFTKADRDEADRWERAFQRKGVIAAGIVLAVGGPIVALIEALH